MLGQRYNNLWAAVVCSSKSETSSAGSNSSFFTGEAAVTELCGGPCNDCERVRG